MNKALQLVLCVLAVSAVQAKPGYLHGGLIAAPVPADTPEVAHAKAAHYAAYNAAAAAALAADHGAYAHRYVGPLAAPPVLINGVPADTPEVAHAKAAHFAAYNAAAVAAAAAPEHGTAVVAHHGVYAPRYYGPLAAPPVLINGVPADTPEVAHAKAAHFAAYNAAAAAAGAHGVYHAGVHGVYHAGVLAPYAYAAGYPAVVNGVPLDTPEVHAAKVAHFAAHAAAKGLLHH